jgi:hypothetical protein
VADGDVPVADGDAPVADGDVRFRTARLVVVRVRPVVP